MFQSSVHLKKEQPEFLHSLETFCTQKPQINQLWMNESPQQGLFILKDHFCKNGTRYL
uniref:Uncharacterized protein n=1 Tax=Arundo donax TaxID=35708 RepID=A0A0A9DPI0_ARUDO